MQIDKLIDRDYVSVSVLEERKQLSEWLRESDYLTVIDEELKAIGIVTLKDIHYAHSKMIDANIAKPYVEPYFSIFETLKIMKAAHTDCLPVCENDKFVGVISLMAITDGLIEVVNSIKKMVQVNNLAGA